MLRGKGRGRKQGSLASSLRTNSESVQADLNCTTATSQAAAGTPGGPDARAPWHSHRRARGRSFSVIWPRVIWDFLGLTHLRLIERKRPPPRPRKSEYALRVAIFVPPAQVSGNGSGGCCGDHGPLSRPISGQADPPAAAVPSGRDGRSRRAARHRTNGGGARAPVRDRE